MDKNTGVWLLNLLRGVFTNSVVFDGQNHMLYVKLACNIKKNSDVTEHWDGGVIVWNS